MKRMQAMMNDMCRQSHRASAANQSGGNGPPSSTCVLALFRSKETRANNRVKAVRSHAQRGEPRSKEGKTTQMCDVERPVSKFSHDCNRSFCCHDTCLRSGTVYDPLPWWCASCCRRFVQHFTSWARIARQETTAQRAQGNAGDEYARWQSRWGGAAQRAMPMSLLSLVRFCCINGP